MPSTAEELALLDVDTVLHRAAGRLADKYTGIFSPETVDRVVNESDVVVTMGCGDVCPVLPGKRYYDWAIDDPAGQSPAPIRRIRDDIDTRVRALLTELVDQYPGANA